MNIIIIGSVRTKSTALLQNLVKLNPNHKNWSEFLYIITDQSNQSIIKDKKLYIEKRTKKVFDEIKLTNNNIIKVLGHNLFGLYNYIDLLNLDKFDQVHLIERHNFFDQICSFTISKKENVFHKNKFNNYLYDKIKNSKYTLAKNDIIDMAFGITHYLKIKEFLLDNNINFHQYIYEEVGIVKNTNIKPLELEYNNLIENYNIKNTVNDIFYKHFDYKTCANNYESFRHEIESLLF
jgi:hypothetical protein